MALQFNGTQNELKVWLAGQGINGSWEQLPNKVLMLRCRNGANVHWAQNAKTLWFSGQPQQQEQLAQKLEGALMQRDNSAGRVGVPDWS